MNILMDYNNEKWANIIELKVAVNYFICQQGNRQSYIF
jgi:hypothetical protein